MFERIKYDVLAICFILLAASTLFIRLLYPTAQLIITPDFGQSDAVTNLTTKYLYASSIANLNIPFWSDAIGGGYPYYANGGMGVWYIPNILFFYFLPFVYAYIVSLWFSVILLGIGMYLWFRIGGISRIASTFGAITIALSGYMIVQFTHLTIVQSLSLFPWIMMLCHMILKRTHKAAPLLLAVVYAQLICIGFAQSIFITSLFILAYTVWYSYRTRTLIASLALTCLGMGLGIAMAAIHLIPALEFLRQMDSNGNFSPDASTLFSYPFIHLITLIHPYLLGNPANGSYPHFFEFGGSVFWENTSYIGILPLLLILAGIGIAVRQKKHSQKNSTHIIFFVSAAVASLLLMTGRNSPVYFLFSFFPFTLFRVPSRFIWVFIISYAWIATLMLERLFKYVKGTRITLLLGVFVILIQLCNSLYLFSQYHNTEPASEWLSQPSLAQYANPGYTYTIGGETAFNAAYLDHGWIRMNPEDRPSYVLRNTFTPDKGALWGVKNIRDYAGRELKRTKVMNDLLKQIVMTDSGHATISATGEKLLSLYGVSNIISTLELTHTSFQQKAALSSSSTQITLFHNPYSLPKAYIATETVKAHTVSEAVEKLTSDTFISGKTALIESDLPSTISGTPVTIVTTKKREGEYVFKLPKQEKSILLVVTENYYPGWKAKTETASLSPFPVNVSQIGLLIPPGTEQVSLTFAPTNIKIAGLISIVSLLITVIGAVFLLKK